MRLKKVIIEGFRSIKSKTILLVDDKVTVLIGANDHGKTNILHALTYLDENLELAEKDVNSDFISRGIPFDEALSIEWHFDTSGFNPLQNINESTSERLKNNIATHPPIQRDERELLVFRREGIGEHIRILSCSSRLYQEVSLFNLFKLAPKIELFSIPQEVGIIDEISRDQLENPEFEFVHGILHLSNLWNKRLEIFEDSDHNRRQLAEASQTLTKNLSTQWNQGSDLEWELRLDANNKILIRIKDPAIRETYIRPSQRSTGFKTFFLFTMLINARLFNSKAINNKRILLFDEPGTYLHPIAQIDLQRSFETISDTTQIVYTTHSVFMINKNYPERNRVISKSLNGTQIDQKPFIRNWKAVRGALGILLTNNFLIADRTLLVEGPSDKIYLIEAIRRLKVEHKIDFDINDLNILDAGDSQHYNAMAKFMLAEGRKVIALVDGDDAGKRIHDQLWKTCASEINSEQLKLHRLPRNKSIEDLFPNRGIYFEAIVILVDELLKDKVQKLTKGITIEQIKEDLANINVSSDSLGRKIDKLSRKWFRDSQSLSKLEIAIKYDLLSSEFYKKDNVDISLSQDAEKFITKLKADLRIPSERVQKPFTSNNGGSKDTSYI